MQFYKPNKSITGHACSFRLNKEDGTVFLSFIKQSGWDAEKKLGSFSANRENPKANLNVMFNKGEIAGFIDAIKRGIEFSFFHTFDGKASARGKFALWFPTKNDNGQIISDTSQPAKGYSLMCQKEIEGENIHFKVGLTFAEGELVLQYLQWALFQSFSADFKKWEGGKKPKETVDAVTQAESDWNQEPPQIQS